MKFAIVLLGALSVVACSKQRPSETAGASNPPQGAQQAPAVAANEPREMRSQPGAREVPRESPPTAAAAPPAEEIRMVLIEELPADRENVKALIISNDDGMVTLKGKVADEQTRSDMVNRVRNMHDVRGVRDQLEVSPKASSAPASTADAVRANMLRENPNAADVISTLIITDQDGVVVVSGLVPDPTTHAGLVNSAKKTPGVKQVKDQTKTPTQKREPKREPKR